MEIKYKNLTENELLGQVGYLLWKNRHILDAQAVRWVCCPVCLQILITEEKVSQRSCSHEL